MRVRIAELRDRKGLSQEDLAERVGLTTASVSRIETNKQNTSFDKLERIADALEVHVFQLFETKSLSADHLDLLAEIAKLDPADWRKAANIIRAFAADPAER